MPNPRVPDAVKRRRGTYRADRAASEPENEALAEYRERLMDAYARAMRGGDVADDIAFLADAEDAMRRYGIADRNGSALIQIAAEAANFDAA